MIETDIHCCTYLFDNLENKDGGSSLLLEWGGKLPKQYLNGFIYLRAGDVTLLDWEVSDYVDLFWSYFSGHMADYVKNERSVRFSLPDQPLFIEMKGLGNRLVKLRVELGSDRVVVCDEMELMQALCNEAVAVLRFLQKHCVVGSFDRDVQRINSALNELGLQRF